jgi:hypothetical protein
MPPHSSHILQPLDVGCFAPSKMGYKRQAEDLMHVHINHITKIEFLPCFKVAFIASITKSNILKSFRGAGLVPFDSEAVVSNLDIRLRTPPLPTVEDGPWQSQTPNNTLKFGSQSKLVLERFRRHVDSSPTSIIEAIKPVKGRRDGGAFSSFDDKA